MLSLESKNSINVPPSTRLVVGASWDEVSSNSCLKEDVDLDLSCIVIDRSGPINIEQPKIIDRIFWGKLHGFGGVIEHSGDNETGEGNGDDEQIVIDTLGKLPPNANAIFFFLSKYSTGGNIVPNNNLAVRVFSSANDENKINKSNHIQMKNLHSVFSGGSSQGSRSFCFAGCMKQNNDSWEIMEMALPIDGVESALDPLIEKQVEFLVQSGLSGGMKFDGDENVDDNRNVDNKQKSNAAAQVFQTNGSAASAGPAHTNNRNDVNGTSTTTSATSSSMSNRNNNSKTSKSAAPLPESTSGSAALPQQQQPPQETDYSMGVLILFLILITLIPIYLAL